MKKEKLYGLIVLVNQQSTCPCIYHNAHMHLPSPANDNRQPDKQPPSMAALAA